MLDRPHSPLRVLRRLALLVQIMVQQLWHTALNTSPHGFLKVKVITPSALHRKKLIEVEIA